jgi:hypothetical protein
LICGGIAWALTALTGGKNDVQNGSDSGGGDSGRQQSGRSKKHDGDRVIVNNIFPERSKKSKHAAGEAKVEVPKSDIGKSEVNSD